MTNFRCDKKVNDAHVLLLLQTKMRLSANGLLFEMNSIDCLLSSRLYRIRFVIQEEKQPQKFEVQYSMIYRYKKNCYGERDGSQTLTTAAERFLDASI